MLGSRKIVVGLVAIVLAAATGAVVGPPAAAQGMTGKYGTLVMPDAVAKGTKCASVTVSFISNGQLEGWHVALEPMNGWTGPNVVLTEAEPSTVISFCTDRNGPGTYRFSGSVSGHLIGVNSFPSDALSGTVRFSITKRATTALRAEVVRSRAKKSCPSGRTAHCSRLAGTLVSGGRPVQWGWLEIQSYGRGGWVRETAARANRSGRVVWFVTITKKQKNLRLRLAFAGNGLIKGSVSRVFKAKY